MSVATVLQGVGGAVVIVGALFIVIGALGITRMPDVFTRLHAASVSDTFGLGLVLIGLILVGGFTLVSVKLVFLLLFVAIAGPVATHAIARAALDAGLTPVDKSGAPLAAKSEEDRPSSN